MPPAAATSTTPSSSTHPSAASKMEDRKRPAVGHADDLAPPSKRQAVNGNKPAKEGPAVEMREETWIEKFQKGAIYREMQEHSRRAATFESRLEELHNRSKHHDDHLRLIDAWWRQLLNEIEMIVTGTIDSPTTQQDPPFLTCVHFANLREFEKHFDDKSRLILSGAASLMKKLSDSQGQVQPDVIELQSRIAGLLAEQKGYMIKLDGLARENEHLSDQLNSATLRYFKAEKKLDRTRSAQVQMLEQQAMAVSTRAPKAAEASQENGDTAEALAKYQEATAVAAKYKEQLEAALTDIKNLTEENSSLKARRATMREEECVRTDAFKSLKSQCEDLVRMANHLEAANRQLRDDCDRLRAERTEYKTQLEAESSATTHVLEADLSREKAEIARIRTQRDEHWTELTSLKATLDLQQHTAAEVKVYCEQQEQRINALEYGLRRYRPLEDGDDAAPPGTDSGPGLDLEALSPDELRSKYRDLEKKYALMNSELASMEKAYRKMHAITHKRVVDLQVLEDRLLELAADKGRMDSRYYATQSSNQAKKAEIKDLRLQNCRSAEIISSLKDIENTNRSLLSNLERQVVELKKTNSATAAENKRISTSYAEATRRFEAQRAHVNELTAIIRSKDAAAATAREHAASLEAEVDKLKARVEHLAKDRDGWKTKAMDDTSEEEGLLRTFALCPICRNNFKNTAIKTCGHLFCRECVDDRIANRMRKCPSCSRAFDKMDILTIHH